MTFDAVIRDQLNNMDPEEIHDWLESLEDVIHRGGPHRARNLVALLQEYALERGVDFAFTANTPYVNTIHISQQPMYPGNREIERRIKSFVRWNAMAMVQRANKKNPGIGGHISSFASSATLYEVGMNHFFRKEDQIYFQGHASPGMYARAFVEGRLTEQQLDNFRQELQEGGGLSSYPHPWLMPNFWRFPTVSMGLGPITAIYQARYNRYLLHRGLKDTSQSRVWAFIGDGECDEPESLGAIRMASREKLDNLTFVINCNLQRLDGPVYGNGKIVQELEAVFRGAGWNVIKALWGSDWDPLLAQDTEGHLARALNNAVDGQMQKYASSGGAYIREHFFSQSPELLAMVDHMTDEELENLGRGGHDPEKVYAAYKEAVEHAGQPTVILAHTVKGYGAGEAAEGTNVSHQQKKLNLEALRQFRNRFSLPVPDEELEHTPYVKLPEDSAEMKYLRQRREALGGYVPTRESEYKPIKIPAMDHEIFAESLAGSGEREASTTMAFVRILSKLLRDKDIGQQLTPIVSDEARTFGMEALFRQCGIYSYCGQIYEPVDKENILWYKESQNGQVLEEGISEAGSLSSFIAAGTSYATHGTPMIPFFAFYSMFGFQRVGDLIWAACDMRTRGFLLGATAGRTTLNGEGLQHEDGHSLLLASTMPNCVAYDPAFSYEIAVIVQNGMHRMYNQNEDLIFYITLYNENHEHPEMPKGKEIADGVLKGLYKFRSKKPAKAKATVQLFGSGVIMQQAMRAQVILAEDFGVASDLWSVTSYNELRRDAQECERWNRLNPAKNPKVSYLEKTLEKVEGPFIAASDYMKLVADQISPWIPGRYAVLGTDGFGRSDTRPALRRFFEVDAESIVVAALYELSKDGVIDTKVVAKAIQDFNIDPDKPNPLKA
ncbi:pyruvate dehydrogenase (acetyl-transferring), homodimeric type [Candidatus Sumerlaeota bacterium]|nr:pyruvate dehydrogenase (acetyl-transferring), homodimeric type [Candidatus Sumerlaeota bacterium]